MLLHSANQTASHVPQMLLDEEAERQRQQRAAQELVMVRAAWGAHTHSTAWIASRPNWRRRKRAAITLHDGHAQLCVEKPVRAPL